MDSTDPGSDVEKACTGHAPVPDDLDQFPRDRVQASCPPVFEVGVGVQTVIAQEREVLVATESPPGLRHTQIVRPRVNSSALAAQCETGSRTMSSGPEPSDAIDL